MGFTDFKDQLAPIIRQSRTAQKVKYDYNGYTYQLIVVRRDTNGQFNFPKRERVFNRENPLLVVWETEKTTHYNWYPCLHGALHRQTKTWDDDNFNCAALLVEPYYVKHFDEFSAEQAEAILTGKYYEEHDRFIDVFTDSGMIFKTYRDKYDRKKYDDIVFDFKWYFYIREKDQQKLWGGLDERLKPRCEILPAEGGWCRVYCENTGYKGYGKKDDASRIREDLEGKVQTYEADLEPATRYVIDNPVKVETNLRILYYDIETDDSQGGIVVGRDQILSIGAIDNDGERFWKATKDEEKLLRWWIALVKDYDVIVGFNSYNFDGEYITLRCKEQFNIFWRPSYKNVRVGHIDLMRRVIGTFGRHTYIGSFSLENLSQMFLKRGKIKYEGRIIDLFNKRGRHKLKEYNMADVELTKGLDEVLGISSLMVAMCEMTGVFPTAFRATENISGMSVAQLLDTFILKRAKQDHIHYPTATWKKNSSERYAGGLVMEPDPGLYKDVCIFDFKSLYPTIIWSWRISPENVKEKTGFQTNEETITSALDKEVKFYKHRKAIFPILVDELMQSRKRYKKQMNACKMDSVEYKKFDIMQKVTKELTNALYGQLGQQGNRYYSVYKAGSITAAGRALIIRTKELLTEWGYKVFYGDTDSVFVTGLNQTTPSELVTRINDALRDWVKTEFNIDDSIVEIEYEKKFGKFIIVGGKNYAGLLTELDGKVSDSIKHRGLECVKRNTIKIAKRKQEEMLEDMLRTDYPASYFIMWLERLKRDFLSHEPDLEDIIIRTTLTKDPKEYANKTPHVRVAERMIAEQAEFYVGMQIPYVILDKKKKEEVHADQYQGGFDKVYYWERVFRPLERLLKVAFPEINWEEKFIDKPKKKRAKKTTKKKATKKKVKKGGFIIKKTEHNVLFED